MMAKEGSNEACRRICVTPVRNEAWIIDRFLAAAKTWADHVVVADQQSNDGTLELLQATPGTEVMINESPAYDEAHRQRILLERARKFEGRRILIGLDADEALSANCLESKEWKQIADAEPGTILRFRWVNILPGFKEAWIPPQHSAFGYVDDNCDFSGWRIHSPRLPQPENAPVIDLDEIVVLHFQYLAWQRMIAKHHWYQAWEHLKHQQRGPLEIFRQYHHMYGSWGKCEIHPLRQEWLAGYDRAGIDFRSLRSEPVTWWDREIVEFLREHGPERFRRIAIWDQDWNKMTAHIRTNGADLSDPRSVWEKAVHCLLGVTQSRRSNLAVRGFERLLRMTGW